MPQLEFLNAVEHFRNNKLPEILNKYSIETNRATLENLVLIFSRCYFELVEQKYTLIGQLKDEKNIIVKIGLNTQIDEISSSFGKKCVEFHNTLTASFELSSEHAKNILGKLIRDVIDTATICYGKLTISVRPDILEK